MTIFVDPNTDEIIAPYFVWPDSGDGFPGRVVAVVAALAALITLPVIANHRRRHGKYRHRSGEAAVRVCRVQSVVAETIAPAP